MVVIAIWFDAQKESVRFQVAHWYDEVEGGPDHKWQQKSEKFSGTQLPGTWKNPFYNGWMEMVKEPTGPM